jgi:hypothetical protein
VWTSDRLARRNWDHCPVCPLCRTTQETTLHLLAECRFTRRIWTQVATWIGHPELLPTGWPANATISEWWQNITSTQDTPHKASRSLTLLVSWEVWKERNNRIFYRKESPVPSVVNKIKGECSIWIATGAKCLASFFVRE